MSECETVNPIALRGENPKDRVGATKPALDLIPPAAEIEMARAFADGGAKYGAFNWRKTRVRARVYIAAMRRHLAAYLDGEDLAPDSGVHHLAHVMACAAILIDAEACGSIDDDRPPPGAAPALIAKYTETRPPLRPQPRRPQQERDAA